VSEGEGLVWWLDSQRYARVSKETYCMAKETYYKAKETY